MFVGDRSRAMREDPSEYVMRRLDGLHILIATVRNDLRRLRIATAVFGVAVILTDVGAILLLWH